MQLKNIRLKIIKNKKIKHIKEKFILNVYHQLFTSLYGYDYYDSYLKVIASKSYKKPKKSILKYAPNSQKLFEVLDSFQNDAHIWELDIYNQRKLIGLGRLEIKGNTLKLKEIALKAKYNEMKKAIWQKVIQDLIIYAESNQIADFYVEIPVKEIKLLLLLDSLGFTEDVQSIKTDEIPYTSLWFKKIESK